MTLRPGRCETTGRASEKQWQKQVRYLPCRRGGYCVRHRCHLLHACSHGLLLVMNVPGRTCGCGMSKMAVWQSGSLPEALGAGPKQAMSRSGMRAILTRRIRQTTTDYEAGWQACRMIPRRPLAFRPTKGSTVVPRHDASAQDCPSLE